MDLLQRLSRIRGSDGRGASRPPLPAEPLYAFEDRGDGLASPPFSDNMDDLDAKAPPRVGPSPASLAVGSIVRERPPGGVDSASQIPWEVVQEVARSMASDPRMDAIAVQHGGGSTGDRGWRLHPDPVVAPYPSRIYAVRDIQGLRWERLNGRGMWVMHYDEGVVTDELPAWLAFGPRGDEAGRVLEQVAALSSDQVRRLPVPNALERFRIPTALLDDAVGHPLREAARRASSTAMAWTENRGWAIDPDAGGHFYSGCYFLYQLSDPHWLSAMGRAMNAAMVAVLGSDVPGPETARVRREWGELVL